MYRLQKDPTPCPIYLLVYRSHTLPFLVLCIKLLRWYKGNPISAALDREIYLYQQTNIIPAIYTASFITLCKF